MSEQDSMVIQVETLSEEINLMLHSENIKEIQSDIKDKLNEERDLIDQLVSEDKKFEYLFYSYHIQNALFLRMVGKEKEALAQEKLSLKYADLKNPNSGSKGKKEANSESKKNLERLFVAGSKLDEEELLQVEADSLARIKQHPDEIFKKLVDTYETIRNCKILSFNQYQALNEYDKALKAIISEISVEQAYEEYELQVKFLEMTAKNKYENNRTQFMEAMLVNSDLKGVLFGDISVLTKENINSRYKQLSLCFHPDKFNEEKKSVSTELFDLITKCRESLIKTLENETATIGQLAYFEEKGNVYGTIADDYQQALKGQFDNLKLLKKENISHFSEKELNIFRLENLRGAIDAYRACCRIADKNKISKKQLEMRGHLSLCYYDSNQFLEAQMCAFATICLVLNSSQATDEDLHKAKEILSKVNNSKNPNHNQQAQTQSPKQPTSDALVLANQTALSLSTKPLQQYSTFDRMNMRKSVEEVLAIIETELILKSDRSLVSYQASAEEILKAKRSANGHIAFGIATMASGGIVGGGVAAAATLELVSGTALMVGGALTGPVGIVIGLATIGLGLWGGISLFQKGNKMLEEPRIREKLNDILATALKFYDEGKYQEFFIEISKNYTKGKSLFVFEKPGDVINPNDIIKCLLSHGFRPDGIAYLLNLIGEALLSGKIVIQEVSPTDLRGVAKNMFRGALSTTLQESASKLDQRVKDLRKKNLKSVVNRALDAVLLKDHSTLAKDILKDSQEMPFSERLEEMRNIANMNIAIICILEKDIEKAREGIQKVRDSVKNSYLFISKSQTRLEVLEDFLWIMSGQHQDDDIQITQPLSITPEECKEDDINSLNTQIQASLSNKVKAALFIKKAIYYKTKAQQEQKTNHLKSLRNWQAAKENYHKSHALDPSDPKAAFGFARCLLKLSKYNQVIEFLKQNEGLSNLADYWVLGSIAYRKQNQYKVAEGFMIEALKIDPKNIEADQERSLLRNLQEETTKAKLNLYKQTTIDYERLSSFIENVHGRYDETPFYKIASYDGGGIRGILPAFFNSEIERRLRTPISGLFQMTSGTSTGGIIAAGLSNPTSVFRKTGPYSASEILQLYIDKGQEIFTTKPWWSASLFGNLAEPKYTDQGRLGLFLNYFGETTLNEMLIDVVIPAVNEQNPHSHIFNRYDEKKVYTGERLIDVLMATTAAPTFFPSYRIRDQGTFVDGGVVVNNPANAAYQEAIRYGYPKEKIFVLSMGTGAYVPDPFHPNLYRGQLFWAPNLHKLILPAQEGDVDLQMHNQLGDRYQRWQVWLENPISLDDYSKPAVETLLEIGHQYIEELYASDDNTMNRLLEFLEKEKEKKKKI